MLNNEQNIERIDAYLRGQLSADEVSSLEKEAASNPALRNELDLQKSILEAIRSNRKAELKQRLNGIDVKSGGQSWWKYAAVAGLVASFGAWQYLANQKQAEEQAVVVNRASEQVLADQEKDAYVTIPSKENNTALVSSETVLSKKEEKATSARNTNKRKEVKGKEHLPNLPKLNAPEGSDVHEPLNKELDAPKHSLTNTPHISASVAGVEVVRSKKHKFHYRYFEAKLFLYGNFDSDTYDILELNTSKGQSLYLKYENNYYSLEQNVTEISKLEQVKDRQIVKELEEIQKK